MVKKRVKILISLLTLIDDEIRHKEWDSMLRSECLQERYKLQQEIKNFEFQNETVIGFDLPLCELDGSYAPVRCNKDRYTLVI